MRFLIKVMIALAAVIWHSSALSNNLTNLVTWDEYSLMIKGQRTFINAAEFHYQRLPVPELWLVCSQFLHASDDAHRIQDVLQKFKANGFNAVSIYFFWSYHSATRDSFDFETGAHNLQKLFDMCKKVGMWVIARPGPYAQTNAGGLALWGADGSMGALRTSDEDYHESWLPYISVVARIIATNQITNDGPVILCQVENELQETKHSANNTLVIYMQQLEAALAGAGIVVPTTHNEKGMRSQSWSRDYQNVGGAVDIYGLDSYPGGFLSNNDCDGSSGFNVVRTYYEWFMSYAWSGPVYLAEFEGGRTLPWGAIKNYDNCKNEHSTNFADIYYKNNIGQRVTLQSIYEGYGGTNWGHSAAPVAYTSNDYMTPLRETREQWAKMWQTKLIQLFSDSTPDLLKTDMYGNGTGFRVSSDDVFSWVLRNPDTGATFTVLQQNKTSSTVNITFIVELETSLGNFSVPNVQLFGRQSKIISTDYNFGNHTLLYSTSDILTSQSFPGRDVLAIYLWESQTAEFAISARSNMTWRSFGETSVNSSHQDGIQVFQYTQAAGTTVLEIDNHLLVLLLDQPTAWYFWAATHPGQYKSKVNDRIFILGPCLVRSAFMNDGNLMISGDNNKTTTLEAFIGDTRVNNIIWNGRSHPTTKTEYGSYLTQIEGTEHRSVYLPRLDRWRSADSLPERESSFDDSRWVIANKTSTLNPKLPLTLPVLYSSDYGFHVGAKLYRGYFDGANHTAVNITASGGLAFGWNAWVNGNLIGGHTGDIDLSTTSVVLEIPSFAMIARNNVLTVLVDYHGHDQTSIDKGLLNPRGLLGAYLLPGNAVITGFKYWKLQGNAGGENILDPVRGPMNEGGLYAERQGWFLPGFDTSDATFDDSTPFDGIDVAGVRYFTTDFELNIDEDLDAPIGISFSSPNGTIARVLLWVNGYQYGKYVPHIGPQTTFPIPPGIINNRGNNTIGLSLWAQTNEGAKFNEIKLITFGLYQTDFGFSRNWQYLQPKWSDRSQYA